MTIPQPSRVGPGRRAAVPGVFPALAVGMGVAATLWHILAFANTDISWLITVGERILDGATPYADIIETNPPGSILLYIPAIVFARTLGLSPETTVMLLTALACGLSLAITAAILRASSAFDGMRAPLLVAATAVLMLLPAGSFGQREHVILLAMLPLFGTLVLRQAEGCSPSLPLGLLAAAGAGIGLAIKPYYGLGLVGPVLLLWRCGGWRGLRSAWEMWLAGAVAASLGVAQVAAFPAFGRQILPLLAHLYVPARLPMSVLLLSPSGVLEALALLGFAAMRWNGAAAGRPHAGDTAALASLGFFAADLIQGKGWPYHAYPALAAALLALGCVILPRRDARRPDRARLWIGFAVAGLVALAAVPWFDSHVDLATEAAGLEPALVALGPHPSLMSLSSDIAVGHPLVRRVEGRWVGTLMSSWISLYVARLSGGLDRTGPYGQDLAFEERVFASDIRARKPDAILSSTGGWARWIAAEPEVERALDDYRVAGVFGSVMLWTRKDAAQTARR